MYSGACSSGDDRTYIDTFRVLQNSFYKFRFVGACSGPTAKWLGGTQLPDSAAGTDACYTKAKLTSGVTYFTYSDTDRGCSSYGGECTGGDSRTHFKTYEITKPKYSLLNRGACVGGTWVGGSASATSADECYSAAIDHPKSPTYFAFSTNPRGCAFFTGTCLGGDTVTTYFNTYHIEPTMPTCQLGSAKLTPTGELDATITKVNSDGTVTVEMIVPSSMMTQNGGVCTTGSRLWEAGEFGLNGTTGGIVGFASCVMIGFLSMLLVCRRVAAKTGVYERVQEPECENSDRNA